LGLLGAHVSVAGGLEKAFPRGEALGCQAIQIFSKNQRQWKSKPLTEAQIDAFKMARQAASIGPVVVHDSYLINLAHPDDAALEKSRLAFLDEIERATALGCDALIFHPGAHLGSGETAGITRISESLNWVIERSEASPVKLLIENTAGAGTILGRTVESLAQMIEGVKQPHRLGICWDTAHGFAGGYAMHRPDGLEALFNRIHTLVSIETLGAFHLNDSRAAFDSRVDRHEEIGDGEIGALCFERIVNDSRFALLPMILEIPGDEARYIENINRLRSFLV